MGIFKNVRRERDIVAHVEGTRELRERQCVAQCMERGNYAFCCVHFRREWVSFVNMGD